MTQAVPAPKTMADVGAELLVEDVVETREQLRDTARATLGVTGREATDSFRSVCRRHGLSYYPLYAL